MATSKHTDSELIKKSKKSCEKLSENLYIIGNEPTLACYRIQEHVHKSGSMLIDKGTEMKKLSKDLQGCCYGIDYSLKAIKAMESSHDHFANLQELITNSLFFKQQLDYDENVRLRVRAKEQEAIVGPISSQSPKAAATSRSKFAQRLSGSFDLHSNRISSSFGTMASSASADLKSVISNFSTTNSPTSKRPRAESLVAQPTSSGPSADPIPKTAEEMKY